MAQYILTETPGECKPVALSFGDIQFSTIDRDGEPWFRSGEIARALEYSSEKSITNLYARNADEFSNDMTVVITLMTNDGVAAETRIFSLRGCHLLAMFARTPVAKAFRKWVLDVLDTLAAEERARLAGDVKVLRADTLPEASITLTPSTTSDRAPLRSVVNAWARLSGQPFDACWNQLKAAFRITDIRSLPKEWIDDAIAWVQEKIDALQKALPSATPATPPALPDRRSFIRPRLSADDYAARAAALATLEREALRLEGETRERYKELQRHYSELSGGAFSTLLGSIPVRRFANSDPMVDVLSGQFGGGDI